MRHPVMCRSDVQYERPLPLLEYSKNFFGAGTARYARLRAPGLSPLRAGHRSAPSPRDTAPTALYPFLNGARERRAFSTTIPSATQGRRSTLSAQWRVIFKVAVFDQISSSPSRPCIGAPFPGHGPPPRAPIPVYVVPKHCFCCLIAFC